MRELKRYLVGVLAVLLLAWLALVIVMALPTSAQAANCAPRATMLQRLADEFGETRRMVGVDTRNTLVETFANEESGTWSITVTTTSGTMCLIAFGGAYKFLPGVKRDKGEAL